MEHGMWLMQHGAFLATKTMNGNYDVYNNTIIN